MSQIKETDFYNEVRNDVIEDNQENIDFNYVEGRSKKRKKKKLKIIRNIFLAILIPIMLIGLGIIVFFKTSIFQEYKEIWVQTAMTTMSHQYLATWFLSDEEIAAIMDSLEVVNEEDSNSNDIIISTVKDDEEDNNSNANNEENVTVEEISGKNYVGRVMLIKDPSKVKMVDTRKNGVGTKLGDTVKKYDAVAGINAGGFADTDGHGRGGELLTATIINEKLLYGNRSTKYKFTGLSEDGKLILGRYTYKEALNAGMVSGVEFGPYIIVNGKSQIKNKNSGGIQPRMAIGQKKDGTMIFVSIDGRKPGYSIGASFMDLQNIFEEYGAYNAANLDGGSSAVMYYKNERISVPSSSAGERYLPNAIIVEK